MSVERIMGLRTSIYPINPRDLRLPFAFLQPQFGYSVESILRHIQCEPVLRLDPYPNTFPNTIQEQYWICSSPGEGLWISLGTLTNGLYFLYMASCNTNGFMNKNGKMFLWLSTRYDTLIQYAMSQSVYDMYISSTVPIPPSEPVPPLAPIALASPIDAISQMSHQALDASEVSVDAVPPVPSEQSPSDP